MEPAMGRGVFFILIAALVAATTTALSEGDPCTTPRRVAGTCTNLRSCAELLKVLTNPSRTPGDIQYLQQSQCGFSGNDPLVCCSNNAPTPNPNVRPPINNKDNGQQGGNGQGGNNNRPTTQRPYPNQGGNLESMYDRLPKDCGQDLSNRIVGGNRTDLDEFPWMALLEYSKPNGMTTACGGVLIHKRYVLTAAHCLKGTALPKTWSLRNVRLGEYDTTRNPDCIPDGETSMICADEPVTIPIEEQIVHENYQPRSTGQHNDIALLRLARDAPFTSYIKPVCLPRNGDLSRRFVVAGWGKTESKSDSDVKLKVSLPLVEKDVCHQTYRDAQVDLIDTQICAGGEKNKDSCRGDSGGPLMQLERDSSGIFRWTSVGVVSFGPSPCGMLNWPGVYTKVYDFMPWIFSKLRP